MLLLMLVGCGGSGNPVGDNTQLWQSLNDRLPAHAPVDAIAVSPKDPAQVFAGAYDAVGLYTADLMLGDWTPDNVGLPRAPVFALLAMPDEMFAGTAAGLYRRAYNADKWQRTDPIPQVAIYALAQDEQGAIYAAADGRGIWKSADRGSSWSRLNGLDDEPLTRVLVLDGGQTLFAGTGGHGVFVTHNGGTAWSAVESFSGAYINLIVADLRDPKTIYVAPRGGLYRSRDAGTTWQALGGGIEREIVHALLVNSQGNELLAGTDARGVWTSQDEGETCRRSATPTAVIPFCPDARC